MARYTGPRAKKARALGEPIFGFQKAFERKKYAPYGVLERQFRNLFVTANSKKGVTGEVLLQLLEARLDNTVYRMGIAPTRRAARQLVSHRHITVNGVVTNIPSCQLRSGDVIAVRGKSQGLEVVRDCVASNKAEVKKFGWLEWNSDKMQGKFMAYPEREQIPEKINEQLIVELYSK